MPRRVYRRGWPPLGGDLLAGRRGGVEIVEKGDLHRVPDDPGGHVADWSEGGVHHCSDLLPTLTSPAAVSRARKPALSGNLMPAVSRNRIRGSRSVRRIRADLRSPL